MKILLFHAHAGDPLSFLIKALTRSPYCHAAILVDRPAWKDKIVSQFNVAPPVQCIGTVGDGGQSASVLLDLPGGHLIVEAYWPKVRARFLKPEELADLDVFDVPAHTLEKEDESMKWLIDQIAAHVHYDVSDLFRFVAPFRAQLGESNDDAYKQHTFCSMLAFNAYRFGGTRLLSEYCHDFEVSPDKLTWSPLVEEAAKLI